MNKKKHPFMTLCESMKRKWKGANAISYKSKETHTAKEQEEKEKRISLKDSYFLHRKEKIDLFCSVI
jgi:hypothetical protein